MTIKTLHYPIGTLVQLESVYHVGLVLDQSKTVELIACLDSKNSKMFCNIVLINLLQTKIHPVTNKTPVYKLKDYGMPLTTFELKERLKKIIPKYQGTDYDQFGNNCQHFAYEVATGIRKSPDADQWKWASGFINTFSKIKEFGDSSNSSISPESLIKFQRNLDQLLYC